MNYIDIIQNRKSAREFENKKISSSITDVIIDYCRKCPRLIPGIDTELMLFFEDAGKALETSAGYAAQTPGMPKYLVLLSDEHPCAGINAGYIMEEIVLKLTDMELSTCWITFSDPSSVAEALKISNSKKITAIIGFGYVKKVSKRLRLNIKTMSDIDISAKKGYFQQKKNIDDLTFIGSWNNKNGLDDIIGFYDDILWNALYAASLAPSYLNRQPYKFVIKDHSIILVSEPDEYTGNIDRDLNLGIAMRHIDAAASEYISGLSWNTEAPDCDIKGMPDGCKIAGYFKL